MINPKINCIQSMDNGQSPFKYRTFSIRDLNSFEPYIYFYEYHFYELFNPEKIYPVEPYVVNHDKGTCTYVNKLHTIQHSRPGEYIHPQIYVIAEEYLTDEEKKKLLPYCQCAYHKIWKYNPKKLFLNPDNYGCISSKNPKQHVIDNTKRTFFVKN